jgi:hypothetical protein
LKYITVYPNAKQNKVCGQTNQTTALRVSASGGRNAGDEGLYVIARRRSRRSNLTWAKKSIGAWEYRRLEEKNILFNKPDKPKRHNERDKPEQRSKRLKRSKSSKRQYHRNLSFLSLSSTQPKVASKRFALFPV